MLEINSIYNGDCISIMKEIDNDSIDAIVSDPPYELGFMGKSWDSTGVANNVEIWKQALRILKPGGYLLSFGGSRTYHRMACAIEDAGFEIRDMIEWIYGSGFPKSLNIGKAIDKIQGNKREIIREYETHDIRKAGLMDRKGAMSVTETKGNSEYEGWGTALKPAHEPICMARKPLNEKTVSENILKYGTGGINIDECRVEATDLPETWKGNAAAGTGRYNWNKDTIKKEYEGGSNSLGRFPANLIHDGSDEVMAEFEKYGVSKSSYAPRGGQGFHNCLGREDRERLDGDIPKGHSDSGTPSRFFYCAKASKSERGEENNHPTVKPIKLMEYLIKLVTTENAIVLDPFLGSGTTALAAKQLGRNYIGIELSAEYCTIAYNRIKALDTIK